MCRKVFPYILCLLILFAGCARRNFAPPVRVVDRVDVSCTYEGGQIRRRYTTRQKVEPMLTYLRLLQRRGRASTDPEDISGNAYKIVLHFSDGRSTVYYQRAERFLSKNRHPWLVIDSSRAGPLVSILEALPTDQ